MTAAHPHRDTVIPALVVLAGTVWFVLVNGLGWAGAFQTADRARPPIGLGVAVVLPLILFALIWLVSGRFRRFLSGVDLWAVTLLQTWRVAGASFIILWARGLLPGTLALPAGLGDLFVGVTAPFVAGSVAPRLAATRRWLVLWNLFGVLDLVVAIVLGVLNSPSRLGLLTDPATLDNPLAYPMGSLPMALIPCFFVPATLMLHVTTLLRVRAMDGQAPMVVQEQAEGAALSQGSRRGVAEGD
jgi:hypothetical protein